MILYDKSGLFLGMGNQELYFLGYEDMEEFKNYHNDFADLFISKPGYIFKFKNFSWIDYTLHSGTPNKKVIVKTKNGKEVETSLIIHEIFLDQPLNGATTCFAVELSTTMIKADMSAFTKATQPAVEIPIETEKPILFEESSLTQDFVIEDAPSEPAVLFAQETTTRPEEEPSFSFSSTADEPSIAYETPSLETDSIFSRPTPSLETHDFKLKIDPEILTNETNKVVLTEDEPTALSYNSLDDISTEELSLAVSEESYPEDNHEDLRNDQTLMIEQMQPEPIATLLAPAVPKEVFDVSESAEKLGLDISIIAQIIEEYSEELNTKITIIKEFIETKQLHEANQEIVKLKSIALNLGANALVEAFSIVQKALEAGSHDERVGALKVLQDAILDFKDALQ